jgi:acetaldehyde dehydrogenase/alcohol dehydrogenase
MTIEEAEHRSAPDEVSVQADALLRRATIASAVFAQFDQEATDRIVARVFEAALDNRVRLAQMAAEETGMGRWQDKVLKNVVAAQLVYESIKSERTAGVICDDDTSGVTEIAQPLGPILAVIPVTNPTSTVIFKALIALKTRNPLIVSPHHRAVASSGEAARICYEAALSADAPDDCVQWLTETSRELTHALMTHRKLALILATGGTGLVRAAYSSGTPAIGVGPGNVPVLIDTSADIAFAVESILASKTFDYGTVCASEQSVVVEDSIADAVRAEFERQGAYFLDDDETQRLERVAIDPERGGMSAQIVGQPASRVAEMAGIEVPPDTRLLVTPLTGVGAGYPLSGEILAPVLAFYSCPDYEAAVKLCIDINYLGGIGHTTSIFANDDARIAEFAEVMNAGRVIVNTPSAHGAVGGIYNTLSPSLTLGCGSGGKNSTTENVTARHLINVKRVCRRRPNMRWLGFDTGRFFDTSVSARELAADYHRNY